MDALAPGITELDTLLAGVPGVTAAHLVGGPSPALVDTGAQTSVAAVRAALWAAGLGPGDLAWIVLTHVHLDHCGGAGDLARAFPRARVVVHPRGAPHLADPARLVAASAAVYGDLAPVYGGLEAVPAERITVAEDGHRIEVGAGRALRVVHAPGHARHHMALLEESTGTLLAGDALGVAFPGAGLHPALPPPEFDPAAALATLDRLGGLRPERLAISHFGPLPDPPAALEEAARQQSAAAAAAREAFARHGDDRAAIARAVDRAVPPDAALATPGARARWLMLRWLDNTVAGLAAWCAREARTAAA
ncbi:MAG: MBL fold metallo-hydrolase [Thermoleophilia bacterium]|jgi:glyoxylase-like metal-dependent hydrolase (beta-lactamase superfamily II)|nr:MBL fold metallo-hydrolase [Thermoleophilia bacterium]